ncbi:unnamed protein product [Adineta ricciae]|uniref:EGF-like domain-containing protein n=1 Tax=Adineta ricciae TaxID=249248 RepID=A0A815T8X8_ADIRI|nr:unnamed protein product [Adineta ricciae]CAF1502481.1 unnamed protein product [Adineta ricciae]
MFSTIFFFLISIGISNCIFCNDGSNPCHLDNSNSPNAYFLPRNGYFCLDAFNGQVICTCPDNSTTRDQPCRICNRTPNPCGIGPSVVTCTDINKSYSCLCNDGNGGLVASTSPCDERNVVPSFEDNCENQGVRDPITNICNCPNGFTGDRCETPTDDDLCDKIVCQSKGICAVRPINAGGSLFQPQCLCRSGFDGEFCERESILGSCSSIHCLNGGACKERQIGKSFYNSCQCRAGWTGKRCERQYFRCKSAGHFTDELMKDQGKYFWCIAYKDEFLARQLSCPIGLKFNAEKQLCLS